jgi:hypothetical protein
MAFCNSCGANLAPGTKFCNKCGAAVPAAAVSTAPVASPPPAGAPTPGSSALKIVLIVVAVIVVFGILGLATIGFIGYRIAKRAHVTQNGGHVKVETPFGSVDTTRDPQQVARDLGVDVYPGAQIQSNGASSATFGNIHTASASFQSSDPLNKVCDFYKSKFPNAISTSSDQNRCTIVSNDQKTTITVNMESTGGATKIQISNVTKSTN